MAAGSILRRERHAGRRPDRVLLLAALLLVAPAGCATLGADPAAEPMAAVPADAAPELHFLVGRELELSGDLDGAVEAYKGALAQDPDSAYLLRRVAELSARRNRIEDAITYAERARVQEPDDLGTRLFLGTLYRFRKDVASAEAVLRGPSGDPVSADAGVLLYRLLAEAKRYDEAVGIAQWLVATEPDGVRGYFALADVRERMEDPAGAEAALRQGLARHPGDPSLYGALARGRRDRGDRAGEAEVYQEILELHPDNHATLLALADALLDLERVDEAVEVLERLERLHPGDLRSILRLGFLEFEQRNYDAAARRFEHALSVNPDHHEVRYFLGVVRRRQRLTEEALAAFERIPISHERYAEARTQIASIHESRGEYVLAIAEVERARAQQESRPLDLYVASLRAKTGDYLGALEFLEALLAEAPGDPELLYNIGVIHGEAKETEQALVYMERVLVANPDHAGALNYVGYTWAEQGQNLDQAEAYVTRALELKPDDGYITDSLGWIYYMRARPLLESGAHADALELLDRALEELTRAHELTGGDPVVSEHLGDTYLLMGDRERALDAYREAIELGPRPGEQPDLQKKYEQLRRELGRP